MIDDTGIKGVSLTLQDILKCADTVSAYAACAQEAIAKASS